MNFIQHESNNGVLGAPTNWDQDAVKCGALPVTKSEVDGVPLIRSFWTPTLAELEAMNKGLPVVLAVFGSSMPPVWIGVDAGAGDDTTNFRPCC